MKYRFEDVTPVITSEATFHIAIESKSHWVIIEGANFLTIKNMVDRLKRKGKKIFVKIGEIEGLKDDSDITMDYLSQELRVDGVVSNKNRVIAKAKKAGLVTVYTAFILDTQSFITSMKNINNIKPDIVEIRPGIMPKVISEMKKKSKISVWATGLITEKKEVDNLIKAGADSIVTSKDYLW